MFGFLTAPCGCFSAEARGIYRGHFCGLCNVMSREYGLASRFLINRDSTFVALLASAQLPEESPVTWTTCCNPVAKKRPLYQSSEATRMVAAVTLSGLETKLRDDGSDERLLKRMGLPLVSGVFRKAFRHAQDELEAMDFPWRDTTAVLQEQEPREAAFRAGDVPLEAVMLPTATAFGNIVAHTARWAHVDKNREALYRLGYALGKLIYLTDCIEDYEEDRKWKRFNPLIAIEQIENISFREAKDVLLSHVRESATAVLTSFDALSLLRYGEILSPILVTGIPNKLSSVLGVQHSVILGNTSKSTKEEIAEEKALKKAEKKRRLRALRGKNRNSCCDSCYCCDCPCPCGGCLECGSCAEGCSSKSEGGDGCLDGCSCDSCNCDGCCSCDCCGSCDCCSCN